MVKAENILYRYIECARTCKYETANPNYVKPILITYS
jgi:hypothetical protein